MKKKLFEEFNGFDVKYRIAADYDLILKVLKSGKYRVSYLPRVLVKMRAGGISNGTIKNIFAKSREDFYILRRNGFHCYYAFILLILKNLRKLNQFF